LLRPALRPGHACQSNHSAQHNSEQFSIVHCPNLRNSLADTRLWHHPCVPKDTPFEDLTRLGANARAHGAIAGITKRSELLTALAAWGRICEDDGFIILRWSGSSPATHF
jgi:hypothetical protein